MEELNRLSADEAVKVWSNYHTPTSEAIAQFASSEALQKIIQFPSTIAIESLRMHYYSDASLLHANWRNAGENTLGGCGCNDSSLVVFLATGSNPTCYLELDYVLPSPYVRFGEQLTPGARRFVYFSDFSVFPCPRCATFNCRVCSDGRYTGHCVPRAYPVFRDSRGMEEYDFGYWCECCLGQLIDVIQSNPHGRANAVLVLPWLVVLAENAGVEVVGANPLRTKALSLLSQDLGMGAIWFTNSDGEVICQPDGSADFPYGYDQRHNGTMVSFMSPEIARIILDITM